MFKIIAIVVVVLVAAMLVYAATRPGTFRVERAIRIQAPAEKIYALIEDFHAWDAWSPYEKLDPAMQRTFGGAARGPGAVYAWDSKGKAGAGRMQIADVSPPSQVTIDLDFSRPMKAHNIAEFTPRPDGDATNVTWSMHGPSPYIAKVMGLFFDMDRMIGKDFKTGLADLKAIAEK